MNKHKVYDLIVLGTGGAGYQVAMRTKEAGWDVAVINDGLFGGTCSVRGCIPKKVLAGAAEVADMNKRFNEIGIVKELPEMGWKKLIEFKRTFTDSVPSDTENALRNAGIDVFSGTPSFTGNLELEVNGTRFAGKKIHIAVGAVPAKLPIEGFDQLTSSDDFLELDNLPGRILFVGGGYVSFEFAHIAARFGSKVTILHNDSHPLPMFDPDIVRTLLAATEEAQVNVVLDAPVQRIDKNNEAFIITSADGRTFESDLVVHGAGRTPAIAQLNLEATGVEYDPRRGVLVDEYLRSTSNPDVYAAGDAAAMGPPLSPVSRIQGTIVADNLLGKNRKQPSYASTPSVIFSTPAAAKVGMLESEAHATGIEFEVIQNDLANWFDSRRIGLKHAHSKVLIDKKTSRIIGAHLIGNHTEDLINIFSLAIESGLTVEQLKAPIFAFPTASDDLRSMF